MIRKQLDSAARPSELRWIGQALATDPPAVSKLRDARWSKLGSYQIQKPNPMAPLPSSTESNKSSLLETKIKTAGSPNNLTPLRMINSDCAQWSRALHKRSNGAPSDRSARCCRAYPISTGTWSIAKDQFASKQTKRKKSERVIETSRFW